MRRSQSSSVFGSDPFQPAVLDYVHNLLAGTELLRCSLRQFRMCEDSELLHFLAAQASGHPWPLPARNEEDNSFQGERLRGKLRRYLMAAGRRPRRPAPPADPVAKNLATLASLIGLDDRELQVLTFLLAHQQWPELREVTSAFGDLTMTAAIQRIAVAVHAPAEAVSRAVDPIRPLRASGLVVPALDDGYPLEQKLRVKEGLLDLVQQPSLDRDAILARFLTPAEAPTLGWDDFSHLEGPARTARNLLGAALGRGEPGVNVLFYGATGTGKSELARLIARELGVRLYAVGKANSAGEAASARERLSSLLLSNQLLAKSPSLLLFDEFEDLFDWEPTSLFGEGRGIARMSKQWFNDALEKNFAPTIWITNRVHGIDPAFLRRFRYAVEFQPLGPRQRERVLLRHLGQRSRMSAADVRSIAQRFQASPGQIASAVGAARLLRPGGRPDRATLERVLAPVEKLVSGVDLERAPSFEPQAYDVRALHCSEDLEALAKRLARWRPGGGAGVSLCLYGPPGTGKSEFVKYLAFHAGWRIVCRRASDIESCWLGETEKNIAQAFREAEEDQALLLFDEVDTFLRDRRHAQRSWEVSAVNEFLQQLEGFRGIVACNTNLWHDIDRAALRRFLLKLEFRYLKPDQAMRMFRAVFEPLAQPLSRAEARQVEAALARYATLAPGDFAVVARRVRAFGEGRLHFTELMRRLDAEVRAKGGPARAIGFDPAVAAGPEAPR